MLSYRYKHSHKVLDIADNVRFTSGSKLNIMFIWLSVIFPLGPMGVLAPRSAHAIWTLTLGLSNASLFGLNLPQKG